MQKTFTAGPFLCQSARGSCIYIQDMETIHKTLVRIPLGSFIVLFDDMWHSGIVGGEGNVRVHGGAFEAWAFCSATNLSYPPAENNEILKKYKRDFDAVHNDDPIDYKKAIFFKGFKESVGTTGKNASQHFQPVPKNNFVFYSLSAWSRGEVVCFRLQSVFCLGLIIILVRAR